jgi:O-antigen ligase
MLEVALISLVLFCLPLFEAPKNAFSVLLLIAWGICAIQARSLGRASAVDVPIAGLAAILWVAPLFSQFGETITPANSAPRWTLLALFVLAASRLDYSRGQLITMLAALMAGGVAAVAESFWVWSLNGKPYPEFRSVGHVNHSSMYSLIPLAAGIGVMCLREWWLKALGMAAIVSTLAFLPPSRSLVGGVAVTVILATGFGVWAVRRWSLRGLVVAVCAVVVVVASVLATPPAAGFRGELVARTTGDDIFSHRDKIFNSALAVWDRHPLLGAGWFSFGLATSEEEVRAVLAADGLEYDPTQYAHFPHGHNLWTTMLVERGLLGVLLITALLLFYFWTFLPLALSRDQLDPSERGAALAALLVAVGFFVAGLGNTTMMNEHGHAGMALIAVCYGYLRGRGLLGGTERA